MVQSNRIGCRQMPISLLCLCWGNVGSSGETQNKHCLNAKGRSMQELAMQELEWSRMQHYTTEKQAVCAQRAIAYSILAVLEVLREAQLDEPTPVLQQEQ